MTMQHLIVCLFQMLFVKHDQKIILLMESSVIMIETFTVKLVLKLKISRDSILKLRYKTYNDLSKQIDHIASQPVGLKFNFSAKMKVADYTAYAQVLTPKLISISSDGQRRFDLCKKILYKYIIKLNKRSYDDQNVFILQSSEKRNILFCKA